MVDLSVSDLFLTDPADHHAASSRTPNQISKLLLLLVLAYDLNRTCHQPRKHFWLLFDEADF
jgi:hypothetical protein